MGGLGRTSRRHVVRAAALTGPSLVLGGEAALSAAQPTRPADSAIDRADAPAWSLAVMAIQDPYLGSIQQPSTPEPGTRYVAAEVMVDNASDQPLNFTPADIRLRDESSIEYRGGTAIGTEPWLGPRNLNGGERSRGWIWFTVAENARLIELLYVAPSPQFRVDIPRSLGGSSAAE